MPSPRPGSVDRVPEALGAVERRQLEYFLAVADHLSFTNASHTLHVAQPSLSQSIKALERELGVQLFDRLRHGIRLTAAGEALVGPGRQALRDFTAAAEAVVNVKNLTAGHLDIAAIPAVASDPLAQLVAPFHARYPGIKIRIAHPGQGDLVNLVRDGDSELGMTIAPTSASDLTLVTFPVDEIFIALPPSCGWAQGARLPADELQRMELIATTANKGLVTRLLNEIGVSPCFSVETAHRDTVLPLVVGGVGGALVPPAIAEDAQTRGAVVCRIEPPLWRQVLLVHRTAPLAPAAAAFVEVVAEYLDGRSSGIAAPDHQPPVVDH
jgi:LysR family carnitine catabolism transcriptional activator